MRHKLLFPAPSIFSGAIAALASLALATVGCQGTGTGSSLFSPAKVPAPSTGSIGTPDKGYYNNSSGNSTGGNTKNARPGQSSIQSSSSGNVAFGPQGDWNSSDARRDGNISRATFQQDERSLNADGGGNSKLANRLRGMRANDATQSPSSSKPIEITDLPPPGSTSPPHRLISRDDEAPARLSSDRGEVPESELSRRSDNRQAGSRQSDSDGLRWRSPTRLSR